LNLYLTVFITGLAIRLDWVTLSDKFETLSVLGSDVVLLASGLFCVLEFFSDKIPWVDSFWDAIHTLIRPVGGGLLAIAALGTTDPTFEVIIGMLAGGTTLVTHSFKASTRLVANASPEPVSNMALSTTEDAAVVGGLSLMALNPLLAALVFIAFLAVAVFLLSKILKKIRARFRPAAAAS
jgi:hypothetical protein